MNNNCSFVNEIIYEPTSLTNREVDKDVFKIGHRNYGRVKSSGPRLSDWDYSSLQLIRDVIIKNSIRKD